MSRKMSLRARGFIIDDFLPLGHAEEVFKCLEGAPAEDWYWHLRPVGDGDCGVQIRNVSSNHREIDAALRKARAGFNHGAFAYAFLRLHHRKNCRCAACDCCRLLVSKEVLAVARQYSRVKLKGRGGGFGSWYPPGSFLSTHNDAGHGNLAFVYQLTKGWRPEFGGCLNLVSGDYAEVESVVVPSFNKLVLFDVSGARGTPHFVSEVARNVVSRRMAITGWYS